MTIPYHRLTPNCIHCEIPLKSIPIDGLNEDIHASAEYRANLIDVLTKELIDNY